MKPHRQGAISAIQLLAGALLIVAATVMPFATYEDTSSHTTTTFRGGSLSAVLVVLAAVSIALAVVSLRQSARLLIGIQIAIGCTATVVSIVLALGKIRAANSVTAINPSRTSYGWGSVVAVATSAALAVTSVVARSYAD